MPPLSTELELLAWSTVLLVVHVMTQAQLVTRERGLDWNAGPRDVSPRPLGPLAGRAARALANFQEAYVVFVALALGLAVSGRAGGLGAMGAGIWFAARIAYLPLYLIGIRYLRSIAWLCSILGLLLMLIRLL